MTHYDAADAIQPGHSLPQRFYCDPAIFAHDLAMLLNRWIFAAHVSEIPAAGDYRLVTLGPESAIIVRQPDGTIRALANVCRHRGSRICDRDSGRAALFTCPYHAWTYRLDGTLRQAREMPPDFDPAAHTLISLPVISIGGLIFVGFGQDTPDIAPAASALPDMTDRYGWAQARIAVRKTYTVQANWKLVLENYHECYHCGPSHPEFSNLHALAQPGSRSISGQDVESWAPRPGGPEVYRVMHSQLSDGVQTGSRNGHAVAPLMGHAHYGGACVFAELGFLSAFLAYPDYGVIYRFNPRDVLRTDMDVIWLVAGNAEAGRDYDQDALTWLWDVTSIADKTIIERNQQGVSSRFYRPGPFSTMEPGTAQYVARYVAEFSASKD